MIQDFKSAPEFWLWKTSSTKTILSLVEYLIAFLILGKACVKPPSEAHASISMEGNMVGNRAWYACQPGYKLVGHSPITCLDQPGFALWNDKFPRCVHMRKRSKHCRTFYASSL